MKRIGCVGDNCVDHYRQTGEDHFGGNPVNVAVYTRRLGGGISYVGAVGTDGRGAALLDALRGRGVDVSHVHVDEGSTAVTYVEHINGDRVFGDYDEGVMAQFALTEEDIAFLGSHALVVSGLWGHAEGYLARIRQAGAVTAFDCSDRPEDPAAQTALPCTDIAFFSDDGSDDEALRQRLRDAGVDAHALEARLIVAGAAGKTPEKLLQDLQLYASDEIEQRVDALAARRLQGEPAAYLVGRWGFYGLDFAVTPDVLIPRDDTEVVTARSRGCAEKRSWRACSTSAPGAAASAAPSPTPCRKAAPSSRT